MNKMNHLADKIVNGFALTCSPRDNRRWAVHQLNLEHKEIDYATPEEALEWLIENQVMETAQEKS